MTGRRFLLASLVVLGMGLVGAPPAVAGSVDATYVAVIDAGSSGTRLALFEQARGVTVREVYRAAEDTPGLSSFAATPTAAGPDAVRPLLNQLRRYLKREGIAVGDVPVALLATAGMRRLKRNNPGAVRRIFASTRVTITSSGFPLQANRILPDRQEALLAWLDANVRAGTLDTPRRDIGIVEVGGASAQVAFRSSRPTGPGVATVRVSGRNVHVVAISYLGLGGNEARASMQDVTSGGGVCFPNNASGTDPVNYLATSGALFPLVAAATPVPSATARFRGKACGNAYATVIQDVASDYPRAVRPRNLSSRPGFARSTFIGLGSIPFVYSDFKISPRANEKRALGASIRANCPGVNAWPRVRALFPSSAQDFAETQCSTGAYLQQFLFGAQGVGLDPARFDAQPRLPGGDPSWSEGYAITVLHP